MEFIDVKERFSCPFGERFVCIGTIAGMGGKARFKAVPG
jgi:hypothetical protein